MIKDRMLKLRKLQIETASGSDPDVIEIEDCTEVYGDNVIDLFPEFVTVCESPLSPDGECRFNAVSLEPDRCLYCRKRTG